MADSIRQQILDAIDTRFKTIKTTAGYKTNIGNNVFDWLDRDLADTELDALIYKDPINELSSTTITQWNNKVNLEIEVKTKSASTTAKQVRMMIEDIYKAIGTDATWGGLALRSNPVSEEISIQQQDKIVGSAKIIISIEYVKLKWGY
jgi:uncharacterized protein (DUF927 family)